MSIKQGSAADYFLGAVTKLQLVLAKKSFTEKDVHDLRVAARKIKTLAADLALFFPDKCWRVRRQAAKLIRKFSLVREQQLFTKFISEFGAAEFVTDGVSGLDSEKLLTIGTKQQRKFTKRFRKCQELLCQPPNAKLLHRAINNWQEEFAAIVADKRDSLDDEQLHKIRIAAKKLRYRLECFAPPQVKSINYLTALQKKIGELHDWVVFKRLLPTANLTPAIYEQASRRIEDELVRNRERVLLYALTALPEQLRCP